MMGPGRRRPALYRDDRIVGAPRWVLGDPDKLMRIPDGFIEFPVFLAVEKGGMQLAGTGFVILVKGDGSSPYAHMYFVTARHCVEKAEPYGGLYVRFNTYEGGIEYVRVETSWYFPDSDADDVAVAPLPVTSINQFDFVPIDISSWPASDEFLASEAIGVGDEVVVVGLFTRRGGKNQNRSIVRAGIIAAMPDEPLMDLNSGLEYDAYLAEVRSVGGLSGSPVFVVLPPGRVTGSDFQTDRRQFSLLGLIRGHWDKRTEEFADFEESEVDELNTGIAIVTPIQKAVDVILTTEELVKERKRLEKEYAKAEAPTEDSALPTSAEGTTDDEFGRFEELTRRLVGVPKKELDEKRKDESAGE
jgi:hypothetical protein